MSMSLIGRVSECVSARCELGVQRTQSMQFRLAGHIRQVDYNSVGHCQISAGSCWTGKIALELDPDLAVPLMLQSTQHPSMDAGDSEEGIHAVPALRIRVRVR